LRNNSIEKINCRRAISEWTLPFAEAVNFRFGWGGGRVYVTEQIGSQTVEAEQRAQ